MTRSSLLGRSASLICLTATVSPVPILSALKTEPNAPLPKQSPNCCKYQNMIYETPCPGYDGAYVVFEGCILGRLQCAILLFRRSCWPFIVFFPWLYLYPIPLAPIWTIHLILWSTGAHIDCSILRSCALPSLTRCHPPPHGSCSFRHESRALVP